MKSSLQETMSLWWLFSLFCKQTFSAEVQKYGFTRQKEKQRRRERESLTDRDR